MTNVNQDDQANVDNQETRSSSAGAGPGLPLRGLAMVLIAVALLLGLWGLYALTQGGNDPENTTASGGDTSVAADADGADGAENPEGGTGAGAAAPAEGEDAATDSGEAGSESGEAAEGDDEAADATGAADATAPAAGADSGEAGRTGSGASTSDVDTAAEPRVNVLNNSTVNGLAETVYHDLEARGADMGVHGNLPDDVAVLQETTIYYEQGDAAGQAAATELAERIGETNGVSVATEPNLDGLPDDVTGEGSITLALIGEVVIP